MTVTYEQLLPIAYPLANRFYKQAGEKGKTQSSDSVYVARADAKIVAAVRLCPIVVQGQTGTEASSGDLLLLRSLAVLPEYRRTGMGSRFMEYVVEQISGHECWCYPFSWLKSFYAQTDFEEVAPEDAPNEPEYVSLAIKNGRVTHVNDEALSPYAALMKLNDIAGKHGVGRIDITENRLVGMKSRGCYETPGGTVMFAGLRAIEELVLDKTSRTWREQIAGQMSHLVYDGRWFTPLCKSLIAASESLAESVNGDVVIKLYKGQATAVKKRSPNSLYSESFATFGEDDVYDQKHAEGFIRLYSLASRIRALNTK